MVIPRNTQILVQRKPPSGKQGTAQRYVTGPTPIYNAGSRTVLNPPSSMTGGNTISLHQQNSNLFINNNQNSMLFHYSFKNYYQLVHLIIQLLTQQPLQSILQI
jgi:hypothetical protein